MSMLKLAPITRTFLIAVAGASSGASTPEIKKYMDSLKNKGQFTEATEDEIEELDNLLEDLNRC